MNPTVKRPAFRLRVLIATAVVCLALTLAATLTACGGDEGSAGDSPFAGMWEPSDSSLDVTWSEEEGRSYAVTFGGSGGGFEIDETDGELTVTLVGRSGARTDAFPATVDGDTLSFEMPIFENSTTRITMVTGAEGTATVTFGEGDNGWDFRKTETIATEE
jgi:hypothetical protein